MASTFKFYGVACSLYTAKARSYLRKQGIEFVEYGPGDPHYQQTIIPAIGRMIIPVLESADGTIVQDGSDIIEYLEPHAQTSAYPECSVMRSIAFLFELFGGEGLLRPAMHFRWNFDAENLAFLKSEFSPFAPNGCDDETLQNVFDFASGRMRKAASFFGVSDDSKELIVENYLEFLALFNTHLKDYPYALGSSPSLADYSLMGPLYGHLYRDPAPALVMRQKAPLVARWVERMNSPAEYWGDHDEPGNSIEADNIPESLKDLLRYVADEYAPEITAHVDYANQWLDARPEINAGTNGLENPSERTIGMCEFSWRGIQLSTSVMPYRFYLLQRLQDCFDACDAAQQDKIRRLFRETGLEALLDSRTTRRVERANHLEVWGPER